MSDAYREQSEFYDAGYAASQVGEMGFPDLKIVDYKSETSGLKILNVGAGDAGDVWYLAQKNEVYAVDGSSVAIEKAKAHGIKAVIHNAASPLPYVDQIFDIVILKDILEHVYEPMLLLGEAARVLKKDGEIIISLPNHFYLFFRLRILFGGNLIWKSLMHNHKKQFEEWNYMHIRFFTWRGVKKMLSLAKLTVQKCYWDFGTLAHYSDPLMYEYAFKLNKKVPATRRQKFIYRVMIPAYNFFNFLMPKRLRALIVSLAPGLLCAGFYLRVKKYEQ